MLLLSTIVNIIAFVVVVVVVAAVAVDVAAATVAVCFIMYICCSVAIAGNAALSVHEILLRVRSCKDDCGHS